MAAMPSARPVVAAGLSRLATVGYTGEEGATKHVWTG